MSDRRPTHSVKVRRPEVGAAFVEYVVVLLLVSVISAIATYSRGRPFVDYYRFAQTVLMMPFP